MKEGIHPKYHDIEARCACGATWKTRSTKPELHLEICNNCHPFFTGRQKLIDTEGRVERFTKRFGVQTSETRKAAAKTAKTAKTAAAKKTRRRREVAPRHVTACLTRQRATRQPAYANRWLSFFRAIFFSSRASRCSWSLRAFAADAPFVALVQQPQRQLLRALVVPLAVLVMDGERLDGVLAQRREQLARGARMPSPASRPAAAASSPPPPRSGGRAAGAGPAGRSLPARRRCAPTDRPPRAGTPPSPRSTQPARS